MAPGARTTAFWRRWIRCCSDEKVSRRPRGNSPPATSRGDLRIAFSILISNTDDHLRNHGFLRASSAGWILAPAFDLNPDPRPGPKHLSTAIDFNDTSASVDRLMDVAEYFRLADGEARQVLGEVSDATSQWRKVADEAGLGRGAIEQMAPAFEHDQAKLARQIIGVHRSL